MNKLYTPFPATFPKIVTDYDKDCNRLRYILPRKTADAHWWYAEGRYYMYITPPDEINCYPAWTCQKLKNIIGVEKSILSRIAYGVNCYKNCYRVFKTIDDMPYYSDWFEEEIDACVDLIIKLHNNNKLIINE